MQLTYSALAVMAISGFVAAQAIPECAQSCLTQAVSAAPNCAATDVACQCEPANKALIQAKATPCIIAACPSSELSNVIAAAAALCANAGSSSSVAPSSSMAPSSSVAPPSSAASVAPSSSAPVYTTSAPPKYSSSATLTTSVSAASTTAASNGTAATSTPVPFTGSASQMAAGLGSAFAIGFAILAAL